MERGVYDLRLWITAESEDDVKHLAWLTLERAREVAPPGVKVRGTTLRPASRSRSFTPTVVPLWRRPTKADQRRGG